MAAEQPQPACGGDAVGCLLHKLRVRDHVSEHQAQVLRSAIAEIETFRPGKTIVRSGETLTRSALLVEGLVARYKDLSDGQRQIMEIHVAGDFLDLHGFLLKKLDHDIGAITAATIAFVPHETLRRITEEEPHLTRLLWLSTLMDAAIQRERILSVGRRPALARISHLLCELYVRLDVVGLADAESYALPVTQMDLADATGLTSVHVNRMLRELREQGLLTFRGGRVTIHDWEKLQRVAEFDPIYLHAEHRPR
ncbi:MAG: Crp/Fnr family transcriptional regulator [Pseudomonadota bacterium]|nr:Crp/Fnr family transcriptional regulator [Pseudomonadota bacterium]